MDQSQTPVGATFSPVANLALDLGSLSTTGYVATPRRRISWSTFGGDSPATMAEDDVDGFTERPTAKSCTDFCSITTKEESRIIRPRAIPRHLKSLLSGSPSLRNDKENLELDELTEDAAIMEGSDCISQDSGYSGSLMDKDMIGSDSSLSMSSRRSSSSTGSPHQRKSSRFERYSSSSSWIPDDELAAFQDENVEDALFPSGISDLMERPLCFRDVTNIMKDGLNSPHSTDAASVRSILSTSKLNEKHAFKRPEPPLKESSQNQQKKRRKAISFCSSAMTSNEVDTTSETSTSSPQVLQRSFSESHTTIMKAVHRSCEDPNLIGDCSRPYALPLIQGKHQDLKTISSSTAMELVTGKYCDGVERHTFVDCRYPYEFDGGHIKDAKNIYTKEGILNEFLKNLTTCDGECDNILIFHCEFSSKRGPSLMRFLRNKDREANHDRYPSLHYPEIYLLEGGYNAFYKSYKSLCEPRNYIPMLHKDHEKDLRTFRAKSKSWSGDSKDRISVRPGLKF